MKGLRIRRHRANELVKRLQVRAFLKFKKNKKKKKKKKSRGGPKMESSNHRMCR